MISISGVIPTSSLDVVLPPSAVPEIWVKFFLVFRDSPLSLKEDNRSKDRKYKDDQKPDNPFLSTSEAKSGDVPKGPGPQKEAYC